MSDQSTRDNTDEYGPPEERPRRAERIEKRTDVNNRFAYYTGTPCHIDSRWSIAETWCLGQSDWIICPERDDYYDARVLAPPPGKLEFKSSELRHSDESYGRFVVRRHHHNRLVDDASDQDHRCNSYMCVVMTHLEDGAYYIPEEMHVSASDMDDLIANDYSWIDYTRDGEQRQYAPVLWSDLSDDPDRTEQKAELMQQLYQVIRGRDADLVRDVLDDMDDLIDLVDDHDDLAQMGSDAARVLVL